MTFFPNIAPSKMFTTNSLCPTICPIHEWRLFFKIFESNLSSFALWKTSLFVILSVQFIYNIPLQLHVSTAFATLSSFSLRSLFLIHKLQHSKYNFSYVSFLFPNLFEHRSCILLLITTLASSIRCIISSSIFSPSPVTTVSSYLHFGACFRALSSILILIFSKSLEQTVTSVFFSVNFHFVVSLNAVAQWLKCCATNRKVAGSIPAGDTGIFHWHKILPIALWPWGRLSP